jgi:LPXTG-motif cell wall-anchored protein
MKHLRRLTVLLVVVLGLTLIATTGSAAQVQGGIHICHVFSPGGPFDIPLDIIIPEADLPIHLAHGDTYPVPAGGCLSLLTTTTTTTTVPTTTTTPSSTSTTTTTAPSSTSTTVAAVSTTVTSQACPTVPPTSPVVGLTEPGVGELPVTGAGVESLGAAGLVLLTAGAVVTAKNRRRRWTPPS